MKLIKNIITLILLGFVATKKSDGKKETNENLNDILSFSLPSGFYDDESIELEIKSSDPNAIIYYTIDGHNPTENSTTYENPFTLKNKSEEENVYSMINKVSPSTNYVPIKKIRKANIIRAVAKLSDGSFSNVLSGTYFVGLNKKEIYGDLPVVSLITDPDNLFDYEKGIYVLGKVYDDWIASDPNNANVLDYLVEGNYNIKGKESERPATFQYIPGNSNNVDLSQDLGIRIKGKASRTYVQKSFRLISREEYGEKNIKYELIPGNMRSDGKGPLRKYKSFNLRNGGNDFYFSRIRDALLQDLVNNNFFENQQNDLAILFIDGEYWGIYNIYEEYSDHYIANNYDIDNKNVVIIKGSIQLEAGDESDMEINKETMKYLTETDMTVQANYDKAKQLLDIEGFAWAGAFYAYIDNEDAWFRGENYAMWRVREPDNSVPKADGKLRVMMYDTEFSTGLYGVGDDYKDDVIEEMYVNNSDSYNTTISKVTKALLKNKEFKNMFINALCDIRNINYEKSRVNNYIDESYSKILPLIDEYYERYGDEGIIEQGKSRYTDEINVLRKWLDGRYSIFLNLIKRDFGFEKPVKVSITSNDFSKGGFTINNFNDFTKPYSGEYFKENILYITGKPVKGKKLYSWKYSNCKLANKKKSTIGIYPKKGCKITAVFK